MNQKKCPQCGEMNPPEAVMCWACYTPLPNAAGSTDAAVPATRSAGKSAAKTIPKSIDDDGIKEKPPAWQLAMIGVGLLSLLAIGVQSFGFSPFGGRDDPADPPPIDNGGIVPSPFDPGDPAPPPAPPVAPPPPPDGNNQQAVQPSYPSPFTVVALPSPRQSVGVMAIRPTRAVSPGQAASLAAFAHQQIMNPGRWPVFQVFVFNNDRAAEIFKDHQISKRGAPLTAQDYRQLSNIWPNTIVCYEFRRSGDRGAGSVRYPFQNPTGWWNQRPRSAR